jgi:hypothetical protein
MTPASVRATDEATADQPVRGGRERFLVRLGFQGMIAVAPKVVWIQRISARPHGRSASARHPAGPHGGAGRRAGPPG